MTLRFCWYQEWFTRSWSITGGSVLVMSWPERGKIRNRNPFVDLFEARLPYGLPCVLKGVRSLEFWSDDMADWNLVFWCHESIGICRHFQAVRSGWHRVFLRICRGCTDCDGEKHRCLPLIDLYLACHEQLWSILKKGSNFEFLQKCNNFLCAFNFYSCNALAVLNSFAQSSTFNSQDWWGFPIPQSCHFNLVVGQGQYGEVVKAQMVRLKLVRKMRLACCELVAWNSNPKIYSWG